MKRGFKEDHGSGVGALVSLRDLQRQRCLSMNQVSVCVLLIYIIVGISFNTFRQGMDPLDSVYLSVVTLLTIGYGDVPIRDRGFQTFYILFGAGLCCAFFYVLAGNILEQEEIYARKRFAKVTTALNRLVFPSSAADHKEEPLVSGATTNPLHRDVKGDADPESHGEDSHSASINSIEQELHELKHTAMIHVLQIALALFIGAAIIARIEGWNYNDALYWTTATISSVGYGDIFPETQGGKVFTIFFAPLGCAVVVRGFTDLVRFPILLRQKSSEVKVMEQFKLGLSERMLAAILQDKTLPSVPHLQQDPSRLQKSEFVLLLLVMMDKLSVPDLVLASSIFQKLDILHEGSLSFEHLRGELERARQREEEEREQERERERRLLEEQGALGQMTKGLESLVLLSGNLVLASSSAASSAVAAATGASFSSNSETDDRARSRSRSKGGGGEGANSPAKAASSTTYSPLAVKGLNV